MPRKGGVPENLKPVAKGDPSRNPKGRPKGALSKHTLLKKWLEIEETIQNPITKQTEKLTQIEIVLLSCLKEARGGNMQAIKELFERYFGKETSQQEVNLTGNLTSNQDLSTLTEQELKTLIELQKKVSG